MKGQPRFCYLHPPEEQSNTFSITYLSKTYKRDTLLCIKSFRPCNWGSSFCSLITPAFATTELNDYDERDSLDSINVPVINDRIDFSNTGTPTYTYTDDGIVIQSYEATKEELALGEALQKPHTNPSVLRHFSPTTHTHSIKDVKAGYTINVSWNPTQAWTTNRLYPNEGSWPTVAWDVGVSNTEAASVSTSVGVTDSVVTPTLGSSYTKGHTISTSTTRTCKVPYRKDGRVIVTYSRPTKNFTCVTVYHYRPNGLDDRTETGPGSATGAPTNIIVNLETRNI